VNGRLSAQPLKRAGALSLAPGDRLLEEGGRKDLSTPWIKRIELLDAENATEVAAREIEQMSRYKFGFLTIFNAVQIYPRLRASFAGASFTDFPVGAAAVFTKRTGKIMFARLREPMLDG
jgi:hypothetical protein